MFQLLCGLKPISHGTPSGFRSGHPAALNDLFVQVLATLSAEGLITLEATWAALSYNLTRWIALRRRATLNAVALASA